MGRISSRYNYRLSKNGKKLGKKTSQKDILPVEHIIIRRSKPKQPKPVKDLNKPRLPIIKSVSKVLKASTVKGGQSNLKDLKSYCCGKKILLVGNAKDIIKNAYGEQIDSYDIVIRMNHGHPIPKYLVNMGKKYNIWAHGFLSHSKQIAEYKKIKNRIEFHIETNEQKLCKRIFDKKAFLVPKKWYKSTYEIKYKGKEMSTGLNAATLFVKWVGTMSEISIVGFDFLKTNNPPLQSASARKFHNTNAERDEMVSMLNESGKYIPFNEKYNFAK